MRPARWTLLLLCAAGLLRDISVHVWKEHPLRAYSERLRPDTRYRWLPPLVPAGVERLAFLGDSEPGSEEAASRLYDARYRRWPRSGAGDVPSSRAGAEAREP